MMSETDKVYVTKYALTDGITEHEVVRRDDDGYVSVKWPNGLNGSNLFRRGEWADSKQEALEQAEKLRLNRIKSLRRSIAKVEAMRFV